MEGQYSTGGDLTSSNRLKQFQENTKFLREVIGIDASKLTSVTINREGRANSSKKFKVNQSKPKKKTPIAPNLPHGFIHSTSAASPEEFLRQMVAHQEIINKMQNPKDFRPTPDPAQRHIYEVVNI